MKSRKGFTLIEILVTLSIIATLSIIGFAAFRIVLQNARDARRSTDLRLVQGALEQFRADQLFYPKEDTACNNGTFKFGCALRSSDGSKKYLNLVPEDSLGGNYKYCYKALKSGSECDAVASSDCDNSTNKCVSYCLYSQLENPPSSIVTPYSCGTAPAPTPGYKQKVAPP